MVLLDFYSGAKLGDMNGHAEETIIAMQNTSHLSDICKAFHLQGYSVLAA